MLFDAADVATAWGVPVASAAMDAADRLDRYAELAVRVGVNLQPGQPRDVTGFVEHTPFQD
jgi:hypothetical protein